MAETAEEIKAALDEIKDEEKPPVAAPVDNSAAIAEAVARGLAETFGARQVQAPAPPPKMTLKQQLAMLTPEQRAQLDLQIAANPTAAMMNLAEMMTNERMEEFAQHANPYMQTSGDLFVENFITQKSGQDVMFSKIEPIFRKELSDIDVRALLQLPANQRQRQLNLRWDAAAAGLYRKAAASAPKPEPPQMGGGGAPGRRALGKRPEGAIFANPDLQKDEGLNQLIATMKRRGSLTDEDVEAIESEVNADYGY
jgi:hypothetical protein